MRVVVSAVKVNGCERDGRPRDARPPLNRGIVEVHASQCGRWRRRAFVNYGECLRAVDGAVVMGVEASPIVGNSLGHSVLNECAAPVSHPAIYLQMNTDSGVGVGDGVTMGALRPRRERATIRLPIWSGWACISAS